MYDDVFHLWDNTAEVCSIKRNAHIYTYIVYIFWIYSVYKHSSICHQGFPTTD